MLYPLNGSTVVRILPPAGEDGVFFSQVRKHRVTTGRQTDIFACPLWMNDAHCAVCSKNDEFVQSKETNKMDYARDNLRAKEYTLYNVLALSGPANKKGEVPTYGKVYVLEVGVTTHRQIIGLDQDPASGWADITNPEKGVNIVIKRTGQKFDTKYDVTPHGQGRSNLWTDLTSRGIDPSGVVLFELSKVYSVPATDFVDDVAARIPSNPGTGFATPQPAAAFAPPAPAPALAPLAPAPAVAPGPVTQDPAPPPAPASFIPPPPRNA
jgi:hypothetical protein